MGSALLLRFLLGFLFGFLLFLLFAFRFYGYSFGIYLLHIREVSGDISFTVRCIDLIPAVFFLDDIQLFSLTNQGNNIRLRIGCGTYSKRCRCNSRLLLADIVSDFLCLAAFGYIIFLDVSGNIAGLDLDPAVCIGFRKNLADGIRVKFPQNFTVLTGFLTNIDKIGSSGRYQRGAFGSVLLRTCCICGIIRRRCRIAL